MCGEISSGHRDTLGLLRPCENPLTFNLMCAKYASFESSGCLCKREGGIFPLILSEVAKMERRCESPF